MFKSSGQAQFDKLLEKATSNLLLEPDWASIMMISDLIRQKDCPPKYAIAAIKKKLHHQNPHVAMFALQVLESIVKNCGSPVHDEVASKQFMEDLRELTKTSIHENVKEKVLELILTWAFAFRKISSYRAVQDVVNIMKAEGAAFKPLQESDAMFVADTAPEWADGECCHRCRTEFGLVNRKHHCRACGQIFCGKCSSKTCTLPKFGIEKEVRVCESCFEKYGKDGSSTSDSDDLVMRASLPAPRAASAPSQSQPASSSAARTKTEQEIAEEEELQLALAISQSEAEAKEMESKKKSLSAYMYTPELTSPTFEQNNDKGSPQNVVESEDPELARYLNRNYWENRSKDESSKEETVTPNKNVAVVGTSLEKSTTKPLAWNSSANYSFMPSAPIKENKDKAEQAEEIDSFVQNLRSQIEMFQNRMKSNSSRGRSIANDTSVQGLFMNITALHSQLLNYIQAQDNARSYFEGLQDKLGQIRDARAALDDLRFEHKEKIRIEAEEQERIRQFQMGQKLQIMRQKKQEYLQYQRQLAMQRMQEQEREMQMRIEQQSRQLGPVQNPYMQFHPQNPFPQQQPQQMPQHPAILSQQQQPILQNHSIPNQHQQPILQNHSIPNQQQQSLPVFPTIPTSDPNQQQQPVSSFPLQNSYMQFHPQNHPFPQQQQPQQMQQQIPQNMQQQQQPIIQNTSILNQQQQQPIIQNHTIPIQQHQSLPVFPVVPTSDPNQQPLPVFPSVPNDPNLSFQQQQGEFQLKQEPSTAELISFD